MDEEHDGIITLIDGNGDEFFYRNCWNRMR